jgi:hypothetical protein
MIPSRVLGKKEEEKEGVLKMKCPPHQLAEDRFRLIMCPPDTLKNSACFTMD